jgi:hypothetical protein
VSNQRKPRMESALSIATLAIAIWVIRFMLPRAVRQNDALALIATVLSLVLALVLVFIAGFVRVR